MTFDCFIFNSRRQWLFGALVWVLLIAFLLMPAAARSVPDGFADLAERLIPAVVNISTSATVSRRRGPGQPPFNEFFEEFFRDRAMPKRGQKVSSLGSGFVIDASGIIITNNHVVEQADEITVNFADGSKYEATLLGRDPKTDLAVLTIKVSKPLPYVPIGNSDKARVGDWVVAVGNPFGLGGSLSAGIISAINRDISAGPYDSFIQTDAAINRGNSGGPLFNLKGEVIGVNSAIISPTGGSVGIGFSIPSNLMSSVVAQLQKYGETRRGWLGVRIQEVTDDLAENLGLNKSRGALISEVSPDGPAEKGGLRPGDVVVKFDGKKVPTMRDLPRIVAETDINKRVRVEVVRRGKIRRLTIVTGRLDEPKLVSTGVKKKVKKKRKKDQSIFGMDLRKLDAPARLQLELPASVEGVLVIDIDAQGRGYENGIRRGDVIVEIAQRPTSTPEKVTTMFKNARKKGKKSLLVLLNSRGSLRFVAFKVGG